MFRIGAAFATDLHHLLQWEAQGPIGVEVTCHGLVQRLQTPLTLCEIPTCATERITILILLAKRIQKVPFPIIDR